MRLSFPRSVFRRRVAPPFVLAAAVALACAGCGSSSSKPDVDHAASANAARGVTQPLAPSTAPASSHPAVASATAAPSKTLTATPAKPGAPSHAAPSATPTPAHAGTTAPTAPHTLAPSPPPPASDPAGGPTVSAAKASLGYTLFTNSDGTVVRWNPCSPIHYAVNTAAAADPVAAVSDVRAAIAKVAAATGLRFVDGGTTSIVPTKKWLDGGSAGPQLVIAWARPGAASGDSDLIGSSADGEGGWWESGSSTDGVHWTWQIERGFVVVNPTRAASYSPGFADGQSRGALLMHELGHAVGLGHTGDQREVMFPVLSSASHAAWGPGDLHGLAKVGTQAGCIGS